MPTAKRVDARLDRDVAAPTFEVAVAMATISKASASKIRRAVRAVLSRSKYKSASVSVAVVDDQTICSLNRQFLNHDFATDVLSFVLDEGGGVLDGEVIVSTDTAARRAAEAGWSEENELLLYVVHGALHLVGHRDKTPASAARMRAAEVAALRMIGVRASPDDSRWSFDSAAEDCQEGDRL